MKKNINHFLEKNSYRLGSVGASLKEASAKMGFQRRRYTKGSVRMFSHASHLIAYLYIYHKVLIFLILTSFYFSARRFFTLSK